MYWSSVPNYLAALLVTPLVHVELLIPIGLLFPLRYTFLTFQKPIRGPQRSIVIFVRTANIFWLFIEIFMNRSRPLCTFQIAIDF
jgi:hypothetical protein